MECYLGLMESGEIFAFSDTHERQQGSKALQSPIRNRRLHICRNQSPLEIVVPRPSTSTEMHSPQSHVIVYNCFLQVPLSYLMVSGSTFACLGRR